MDLPLSWKINMCACNFALCQEKCNGHSVLQFSVSHILDTCKYEPKLNLLQFLPNFETSLRSFLYKEWVQIWVFLALNRCPLLESSC